MHCVRTVTENLYWVGANDHRLALFENIHPIPKGVSYNAYLLLDEKSVLFDTVDWSACRQLLENLEYLLNGTPLDYLVINHMEPDHGASIEEILTMVGATGSMMDVVNVKIYKDMRNKVNRVTNCETSNIEKTVSAATVQAADIRYLQQRGLFDTMEVPLKQTAQARLENPDMSLRELGELLGVSRSGINHRLQKISQLAKQARDEEICGGPQKK